MMKQTTITGQLVAPAPHPDDAVTCSDGCTRVRRYTLTDCEGGAHANESDRDDRDVEIVTAFLDQRVGWLAEYAADGYYADHHSEAVYGDPYRLDEHIEYWLCETYPDESRDTEWLASVTEYLRKQFRYSGDCDAIYDDYEYAKCEASGAWIGGFEVGEIEDCVVVNDYESLRRLHRDGRLTDILDQYNGDGVVRYDEGSLSSTHPEFYLYATPGGRWDFVIPEDTLRVWLADWRAEQD